MQRNRERRGCRFVLTRTKRKLIFARPAPVLERATARFLDIGVSDCMCGIVGIVGRTPVAPLIVDALKRLEYRGYDSAGVATIEAGTPRPPPRRGQARSISRRRLQRRAARRHDRHRPYALGDPRRAQRDQRASAFLQRRRHRPQRHHREFRRTARRTASPTATNSPRRPTPRSSRIWSRANCDAAPSRSTPPTAR